MKPNGCHNRPNILGTYLAQDGYHPPFETPLGIYREPKWKEIHHVMTTECQYSKHRIDPGCAGCKWNQNGSDIK